VIKPQRFGRYLLLDRLSTGGMAEVFLAKSSGLQGFEKVVAIKRILPSVSEDSDFTTMFVDEARISANLNHVNIAQIFEFGQVEGQYYIAMEYIPGKDLRAIQAHLSDTGRVLEVRVALHIAARLCQAIDYAHRQKNAEGQSMEIIHRDVSPPNVLVAYEGAVKLIDFGIAKALTRSRSTATGMLKGKLGYLSPEQAEGHELDGRSDIFALGTVLWELLTGVRLFHEATDMATLLKVRRAEVPPPSELNSEITAGLDAVVLKAVAREPEKRFQRAELFYEALERVTQQGLGFSAVQLGRFMAGTFPTAREEQTAVPTPSPLRAEVLAPEPALAAGPRPSHPEPKPVERTPKPEHTPRPERTPRPEPEAKRTPLPEVYSTGPQPLLTPEELRDSAPPLEVPDPTTRVSGESAQIAKSLTGLRPLEDRTGPTQVPERRVARFEPQSTAPQTDSIPPPPATPRVQRPPRPAAAPIVAAQRVSRSERCPPRRAPGSPRRSRPRSRREGSARMTGRMGPPP